MSKWKPISSYRGDLQYLLKISLLILRDIKFLLYRCKSETLTKAADDFVFWRRGGGGVTKCKMLNAGCKRCRNARMQNAECERKKIWVSIDFFRIPLRSVKEKSAVRTYIGQKLEDTVCEMDPFFYSSCLNFLLASTGRLKTWCIHNWFYFVEIKNFKQEIFFYTFEIDNFMVIRLKCIRRN